MGSHSILILNIGGLWEYNGQPQYSDPEYWRTLGIQCAVTVFWSWILEDFGNTVGSHSILTLNTGGLWEYNAQSQYSDPEYWRTLGIQWAVTVFWSWILENFGNAMRSHSILILNIGGLWEYNGQSQYSDPDYWRTLGIQWAVTVFLSWILKDFGNTTGSHITLILNIGGLWEYNGQSQYSDPDYWRTLGIQWAVTVFWSWILEDFGNTMDSHITLILNIGGLWENNG